MNETLTFENYQPQNIIIGGGGSVIGLTTVLVNGVDVTEGSVAYVVVPTKLSELVNDTGFINHEVDPTVPYHVKQISLADINKWNNKQDLLVSGTNIKTINNESILGSGNIEIEETPYTAGIGIEIQNHVINNTITSYNDLTDLPTIPTKTSELNNDSNYVTSSELSDVAFSGSYLDLSNTPSNLSEFTNDEGFITDETNTLQNYMLSEYLDSILPKVTDSGTDITLDNTAKAPMKIELSPSEMEQASKPTPDNPQTIHTTTGDNEIKDESKNILPNNVTSQTLNGITATINADKTITLNGTNNNVGSSTFFLLTEVDNFSLPARTYYSIATGVSGVNIGAYDGTNYYTFAGDSGNSITLQNNTSFASVYLQVSKGNATTFNNYKIYPILSLTSVSSSDYEPYSLDTYPLTLETLEYSKIGNYEDEFIYNTTDTNLELNKWYLKKNIGKVVYDGSSDENWSYETISGLDVFEYNISDMKYANVGLGLSNYYTNWNVQYAGASDGIIRFGWSNRYIYCYNDTTRFSGTLANWKTWLSTHNLDVYYVLDTPQYILLNDTLQTQLTNIYNNMISKKGQTNISQTNQDIGFNITATAFAKIGGLS